MNAFAIPNEPRLVARPFSPPFSYLLLYHKPSLQVNQRGELKRDEAAYPGLNPMVIEQTV